MIVLFHRTFKKQYKKLSAKERLQCDERIGLFMSDPTSASLRNHALYTPFEGCRSINITGDLRVILFMHDEETAEFLLVGTHSELYS